MRALKPVLGLISTFVAVLYCGGLIYYFLNITGAVEQVETNGLGPTILGLGAVGLFFLIVLIAKIVLIFVELRSPRSGGSAGPGSPPHDGESEFDADAVVARYLARQAKEGAPGSPAPPSASERPGPAGRPGFGRKIR